jgi:hypothetical protein
MSFLSCPSSAAMTVAGGTEEQCTMAACLEERQRGDISLRGAVHGSGWPGMEWKTKRGGSQPTRAMACDEIVYRVVWLGVG